MDPQLRPAFIEGERGKLFALLRKPAQPSPGVLIVPPFAEEMNKSRHLFTEVAHRLAASGVAVAIVDLFGTGDSEGEFAEADWEVWKSDLAAAANWCAAQGIQIKAMLGMRLGCALACEMSRETALALQRCVFWQPVLSGSRALDQFLRLRVAASMMQRDGKETLASLRSLLRNGGSVCVAGYDVNAKLAAQLDNVSLTQALHHGLGAVSWIELVRAADALPPKPALDAIAQAQAAGVAVELQTVQGEPFWSAVELGRNPALIERTVAALANLS